jgi:hypothetical protein
MSTDIAAEVIARYDMREYVAGAGVQQRCKGQMYWTFDCPFHSERSGSFQVWDDHGHCYGCNWHGDVAQFVEDYEGVSFSEALRILGASQPLTPRPTQKKTAPEPVLDFRAKALEAADNFPLAASYLTGRGVRSDVAMDALVGAVVEYPHTYRFINTQRPHLITMCTRYSFPNALGATVRSINYRRDDELCRKALQMLDTRLIEAIQRDQGRDLSEKELMDLIFGDKYLREGPLKVINAGLLVNLRPDGSQEYKRRGYVIANEGKEIDVLTFLSHGYPAVGIPQVNALEPAVLFQNVTNIFIPYDNDENGAGMEKAKWIRSKLGRGLIIPWPKGMKDANDTAQAGVLQKHLERFGIRPVI